MAEFDPYAARQTVASAGKGKGPRPKERAATEALAEDKPAVHVSDGGNTAREQLRSFVERIERLEEEKKVIADDIKDVYGEAKAMGFDTKVLRRVIAIRKQDENERLEQEAVLDTYLSALGMLADREGGE
jgi:uncharacterized protein (UPF0335 family)